ncbi:ATP-binding protein [Microvirga subterranea]|uniref:Signal transduction histidine kinase n=1 Tax=Microvirga subterranea TaxID=186651 RepID=A0A370HHC7_9HYPH|nr:ATP-binding protein [Microvirga subterranea]RDI57221.1 signal transduction histidine kinase [Microvirga subterranea]
MDGTTPLPARSSQGAIPRLRRRVAIIFMATILAACLVAAALLVSRARGERDAIEHQARHAAQALSFGFDQEVAAVNFLLKGLSKSPAVLSGDAKAVYDQFKATPLPEGSWLNLSDLERQLVNTLRPFGAPLPRHSDFANYQEQIDRIRDRRWTVSGRMLGLVKGGIVVALSLRLDDADGRMSGYITTFLSEERLRRILADQAVSAGWTKGLYDRRLQPVAVERDGQTSTDTAAPAALTARLADVAPDATIEGTVEAMDENGVPVLVAFRRSGATNWTTAVAVPLAALNAPVTGALWQMAGPVALLLLAGGLAALFTARQVEEPLRAMSGQVIGLSDRVLAHQEEERRAKGLLQASLDALSAHVAILDAGGTVIAVNRAWHRFAEHNGYAFAGHGIGLNYLDVCRSAASGDVDARLAADGLSALLTGERTDFGMEYTCGERWFLLRAARFTHEGAIHAVVAHEDVTDVIVARNEVRTLSGDLLHLQDEERQRIGAELHDSTTQHLTAAGLGLARIHVLASEHPDIEAALGSVGTSIDEAQKEIRTLSFLLFPPSLERDGLALTLRDFIHGFARRAGLTARVRIDPAIDIADANVSWAALRVTQEALANIRRHAQATRISVDIRTEDGSLRLRISDNGIGLPGKKSTDARPKLGVGIPGMEARVRQLGGELSVTSGRRGVTVRAALPLVSATNGAAAQPLETGPEPKSGFAPMA